MFSEKQSYLIMFNILDRIYFKIKSKISASELDYFSIWLGGINPYLFLDTASADPAYYSDWQDCIHNIKSNSSNDRISRQELLEITICFIQYYICKFSFNLDFLLKMMILFNEGKETDDFSLAELDECIGDLT